MQGGLLTIYCKSCGAPAQFDIIKQNYRCLSCDSEMTQQESVSDLHAIRKRVREELSQGLVSSGQVLYECASCGAKITQSQDSVIHKCDFCGAKVVGREMLETDHLPESIIPFFITLDEAKERVKSWAKRNDTKESKIMLSNLNQLTGYYLPYQMVQGPVSLDVYREDASRRYYAEGYVSAKAVNTSQQLDNLVLDAMEPYEWSKLEPLRLEYLAGQKVKLQDISAKKAEDRVKEEVEEDCYELLCKELHSDGIRSSASVGRASIVPALLPAYILRTHGLLLAVNGQTGRVSCSSERKSYKFSWIIEPILTFLILSGALFFGFRDWQITGIGAVLIGILLAAVYGENQTSLIKRVIFSDRAVRAKREGRKLIISDEEIKNEKVPKATPIFFESIDGVMTPVKIRGMTFSDGLKFAIRAALWILLPVIIVSIISIGTERSIPVENFGYGAAWYSFAIPSSVILWIIMRKRMYENPKIFYNKEGRRVRYRAKKSKNSFKIRKALSGYGKTVMIGAIFLLLLLIGSVGAMLS